jgi:MFS family permease
MNTPAPFNPYRRADPTSGWRRGRNFRVISIIIAADLMRGTGRFNLAQGLVALSTGLGPAASNVCAGFVVQVFGYTIGFVTLAAIAVGGLVFFALLMPETKPDE